MNLTSYVRGENEIEALYDSMKCFCSYAVNELQKHPETKPDVVKLIRYFAAAGISLAKAKADEGLCGEAQVCITDVAELARTADVDIPDIEKYAEGNVCKLARS